MRKFLSFSPVTAIEGVVLTPKATKYIINGQVIIERNGVRYNVMGQRVEYDGSTCRVEYH